MDCVFNCHITQDLREQLANRFLRSPYRDAIEQGIEMNCAYIEIGYLGMSLRVTLKEDGVTPCAELFMVARLEDGHDLWSYLELGYVGDHVHDWGLSGEVNVNWFAPDWKDQLFREMLWYLAECAGLAHEAFFTPHPLPPDEEERVANHNGRRHVVPDVGVTDS